jgi:hypothetical protein
MEQATDKPRFTTIVHTRSVTNCIMWEKINYPNKYGVYDNLKQCQCVFIDNTDNRKFTSYEQVKQKAEELTAEYEACKDKDKFFYF